jgi:hypothetical protein
MLDRLFDDLSFPFFRQQAFSGAGYCLCLRLFLSGGRLSMGVI